MAAAAPAPRTASRSQRRTFALLYLCLETALLILFTFYTVMSVNCYFLPKNGAEDAGKDQESENVIKEALLFTIIVGLVIMLHALAVLWHALRSRKPYGLQYWINMRVILTCLLISSMIAHGVVFQQICTFQFTLAMHFLFGLAIVYAYKQDLVIHRYAQPKIVLSFGRTRKQIPINLAEPRLPKMEAEVPPGDEKV